MSVTQRARTFRDGFHHHPTCDGIYTWQVDPWDVEINGLTDEEASKWMCDCQYYAAADEI